MIRMAGYRCERCSHKWVPRGKAVPVICPKCKSPYWDRKRKLNKKGSIVALVSLKTYIVLIVIGLLIFSGWYFFGLRSLGQISLPAICPKGIVPERINICNPGIAGTSCMCLNEAFPYNSDCNQHCVLNETSWADGSSISCMFFTIEKGYKEGQNTNYFYISNVPYGKQPISPDGVVGKAINLKIDLVLDSKNKTEEGYKVISYKCKS